MSSSDNLKSLTVKQQLSYIQDYYKINIDLHLDKAKQYLTNISFCRLKLYFYTLQNSNYSIIIKYYDLDRKLRLIILDAIERIEVSLKAVFINRLCEGYDNNPLWYNETSCFQNEDYHIRFIKIVEETKYRHSSDRDMKKYTIDNLHTPIWVIIEKLSFEDLSKLFSFVKISEAELIAHHFKMLPDGFKDHLHCLTYIRKIYL